MESEIILHSSCFFTQHVCSTLGCEWKIIVGMLESSFENKSRSHFLEEIFQPADIKNLRLRSAAFQTQLSHGVWSSPFKRPATVSTKTVSSLLRGRTKTVVFCQVEFFPNNVNANDRL